MVLTKTLFTCVSSETLTTTSEYPVASCLAVDCSEAIIADVDATITYSSNSVNAPIVRIYASADGTNYGYSPIDQFTMPFAATSLSRRWSKVIIPSAKYLKATMYNADTTTLTKATVILTIQKST